MKIPAKLPDDFPDSIRAHQLARFYSIHVVTLREWCREGKHPKPIKLSKQVHVFLRSDIEEFLQSRIAAA